MPPSRREAYTEATRQALVTSARRLFGTVGYGATSLDEIAHQEGLTKGAVYHHFKNKETMFEAVIKQLLEESLAQIVAQTAPLTDPRQQALVAIDRFLDLSIKTEYQQIVLRDGPAVLGWARWKELEKQSSLPLIEGLVGQLMEQGFMETHPIEMVARLMMVWIVEVAFMVTEATDPAHTREQAKTFLVGLLKLKL